MNSPAPEEAGRGIMADPADDVRARAALFTLAWATLALLGLVFLFNLAVNPTGTFPWETLRPLTWPARAIKVERLADQPRADYRTLILGSSRTMKLEPSRVRRYTGTPTFNGAVNAARAEDWYVFLRYMLERGQPVETVVLGVDLEAFHDGVPVDPRLLGVPALARYLDLQERVPALSHAVRENLSAGTLQLSLESVGLAIRGYPPSDLGIITRTGFQIEPQKDSAIAEGSYSLRTRLAGDRRTYARRFEGYSELSAMRVEYFRRFLALCRREGIELHLFITPLHPAVVDELRRTRDYDRIHGLVLELLEEERAEYGYTLRDFSEVSLFGGDPELYYDGAHPRVENTRLLVDRLLGPAG